MWVKTLCWLRGDGAAGIKEKNQRPPTTEELVLQREGPRCDFLSAGVKSAHQPSGMCDSPYEETESPTASLSTSCVKGTAEADECASSGEWGAGVGGFRAATLPENDFGCRGRM